MVVLKGSSAALSFLECSTSLPMISPHPQLPSLQLLTLSLIQAPRA